MQFDVGLYRDVFHYPLCAAEPLVTGMCDCSDILRTDTVLKESFKVTKRDIFCFVIRPMSE